VKISNYLPELEGYGDLEHVKLNEGDKNKVISLREKIWYHSSRFYELIPHEEFKNDIVPPIESL
jgi:hypothetical protein